MPLAAYFGGKRGIFYRWELKKCALSAVFCAVEDVGRFMCKVCNVDVWQPCRVFNAACRLHFLASLPMQSNLTSPRSPHCQQ